MKTLILKRHATPYTKPDGGLKDEGVNNARLFAQKISGLFQDKSVGVFCSSLKRTRHTAEVVIAETGLDTDISVLDDLYEYFSEKNHYLQGLGKHLPPDIDVALCITHAPTVRSLKQDLRGLPPVVSEDVFMELFDMEAYPVGFPSGDWLDLTRC